VVPQGAHGLECRTSRGEGILHDDDRCPLGKPALDEAAGPVLLRLLPDGEGVYGRAIEPAPVGHGVGYGVRSHGETAHPRRLEAGLPDGLQAKPAHQRLTLGAHGGPAGIDVVGRTGAAGEGKVTQEEGPFDEELEEAGAVVHVRELRRSGVRVKDRRRRLGGERGSHRPGPGRPAIPPSIGVVLLVLLLAGCDREQVVLPQPRFAQVGEVQVEVRSPVGDGVGELQESFVWRSEGPWVLAERMTYQGEIGSETVRRPTLNPGDLTTEYSSLIQQLTETPGLRLFSPQVPSTLVPQCDPHRSIVRVTLRDRIRDEQVDWVRCADGTFFTTTPGSAGPDPGAPRVVTAAQLIRFFTMDEGAVSSYLGSLPFRSIDRGEFSPARPEDPRVFLSETDEPPADWIEFWAAHSPSAAPPPQVDWEREMVLLAAVGQRREAGDSVKVQRILPIDQGTRIEVVEQVPGDFCSPAARDAYPFHLVVAPRAAAPIGFNDPILQRIPCGI
jgi:hypothetical protein